MASITQKTYWKAPYFIKKWMASFNARKLDRERHGPLFEQVLAEIAERDSWSREQLLEYQRQQLRSLIQQAAAKVPYYRKMFSETGIDPASITSLEDLQRLPILEKETIRTDPKSLLDETIDIKNLRLAHTSGTTGTPLDIYNDIRLKSAQFAYMESRCHAVAGMRRCVNRSVSIGVRQVAAPNRNRPPFWVYSRRWNQLYMSCYHLSPKYLGYYVDELRRFKADYIEGYPSSVYAIARYIVENNLEPVPFKACFTTAETLFDYHREAVEKAFCCKTYNQYGCAEQVVFAAECPGGSMHLSPEHGILEVVDDNDQPVPIGQTGHLIGTSLINRVHLLIRFRTGDIGALKDGYCSCGSPLPLLGSIEGRTDDVVITRDGRQVGRLNPVFEGAKGIIEAQIVQDDYDKFRIRVVPSRTYKEEYGQEIKANLLERIGQGDIKIQLVEQIERTAAGKFKAIVNNLTKNRNAY